MKSRLYIGAHISLGSIESLKVLQFKSRNDYKFSRPNELVLALVPPFELAMDQQSSLIADLHEGAEDFFTGINHEIPLQMRGLDFISQKKKHLLFLDPWLPEEIYFYREYMYESIWQHRQTQFDKVSMEKRKLAIGRYSGREELQNGLMLAQLEFAQPFNLMIKEINVYQKKINHWDKFTSIVEFGESTDRPEFNSHRDDRFLVGS